MSFSFDSFVVAIWMVLLSMYPYVLLSSSSPSVPPSPALFENEAEVQIQSTSATISSQEKPGNADTFVMIILGTMAGLICGCMICFILAAYPKVRKEQQENTSKEGGVTQTGSHRKGSEINDIPPIEPLQNANIGGDVEHNATENDSESVTPPGCTQGYIYV